MKTTLVWLAIWLVASAAFGQGTVNFGNRFTGTLDAPVFDVDGVTLLRGPRFVAQLYAGPSATTLTAVGAPIPFRDAAPGAGAGYFPPELRSIPSVAPGAVAHAQVRAWDANAAATYEAAQAAGAKHGASATVTLTTGGFGDPPSIPSILLGLQSFRLQLSAPPVITTHPVAVTTGLGGSVRFEVVAGGSQPLTYQWRRNGETITGATLRTLDISPVTASHAGTYSVRVSNAFGFVDSNGAALVIAPIPVIAPIVVTPSPPLVGRPLRLETTVEGTGPLTFQWRRNNVDIPGATATVFETASADPGTYTFRATGPGGTASRDAVTVVNEWVLEVVVIGGGTVTTSPQRTTYANGTSVTLTATAEAGYAFAGWSGDVSGLGNPTTFVMNGHKRVEAGFAATGGTVYFVNRVTGQFDAPIFDTDGVTPLSGPDFVAQLYAGPTPGSLAPIGQPVVFRTGVGVGYFPGEDRSIPTVPPGSQAFVQVRAWYRPAGATFEAAQSAGAKHGSSAILTVTTGGVGSPPSLPASLAALQSFRLQLGGPPTIQSHPQPVTTGIGGTAHFEVLAAGTAPLTYQWRKNGQNLQGANLRTLDISPVTANDAGTYSVRVTNTFGFAESTGAALVIAPIPVIAPIVVTPNPPLVGRPLRLETTVEGTGPLTFQWRRNNVDIPGATATVFETAFADPGTYTFRATGPGGTATRDAVTVVNEWVLEVVVTGGGSVATSPVRATYANGTSVTLTATPQPGYVFAGWSGDLTGTANPASVVMNGHKSVEAGFSPTGGTIFFANRITGTLDAPVFDVDGTTRLAGSSYVAQLYAGPTANSLAPIGPPIPFRTDEAAGYFPSEDRSIPTVAPGSPAFIQVRAWFLGDGDTFEEAQASGGKAGASATLTVVTGNAGSPPTLPTRLLGLQSFQLRRGAPPVIQTQPQPVTTGVGGAARFEVLATGTTPFTYQWRRNGQNIEGATLRTLDIAPVNASHAGTYSVRVSNAFGFADSDGAALVVAPIPVIASILVTPSTPLLGQPLRLEATVEGAGPLAYQWRRDNVDIPGATSTLYETAAADPGTYSLRVTGPGGTASRDAVSIVNEFRLDLLISEGGSVSAAPVRATYPPGTTVTLTAQAEMGYVFAAWGGDLTSTANPVSLVMNGHRQVEGLFSPTGGTVRFANLVTGTLDAPIFDTDGVTRLSGENFLVQLYAGPTANALAPVGNAVQFLTDAAAGYFTAATRSITTVPPGALAHVQVRAWARNAGVTYEAAVAAGGKHGSSPTFTVLTGNAGSPPSLPSLLLGLSSFSLRLGAPPRITTPPQPITVAVGAPAAFQVVAEGFPAPQYEWRKNGDVLPGATSPQLAFPAVQLTDAGSYSVRVFNDLGEDISAPVTLTVLVPPAITVLTPRVDIFAGDSANLSVSASGTPPIAYQWFQGPPGAINLPVGANSPTFATGPLLASVSYWVRASNAAGTANSGPIEVVVSRRPQTLTFAPPTTLPIGSPPLTLLADASSGLPVTFTLISGPATLAANILTINGTGPIVIRASQAGDSRFLPAAPVDATIVVGKATAVINLASLSATYDGQPHPVTFTTVPPSLPVTILYEGNPTPPVNAGSYRVLAAVDSPTHEGTAEVLLVIARRAQTIAFNLASPRTFGTPPIPLAATASSGLPVAFERISGPATLAGNTLTLTGAGTVVVRASQPGDLNHLPAPTVDRSLVVNPAAATVTLTRLEQVFDGTPRSPDVSVNPPGLIVRLTFDGRPDAPSAVGEYAVAASVQDPNYSGQASGTFRIVAAVNIAGRVYEDGNGNGTLDPGEIGIPGATLHLLALDAATELRAATSGPDGTFSFSAVASGSYYLREQNPPGFASTTPDLRLVAVNRDTVTQVEFGDQPVGTLAGTVFEDLDADGQPDDNEKGLAGVAIRLSGPQGQSSTVTAEDGTYRFTSLNPGLYVVEEIDPPGYVSTTPNVRTISVAAGGAANANFGDRPASTIAGVVFLDVNGNGSQDTAEPGIPNVAIRLTGDGTLTVTFTGPDGSYLFEDIPPGGYTVEEIDPPGYVSTTPNVRALSLPSGGSAIAHFGDQAAGTVSGFVFEDLDGNGLREANEPGISGVPIRLIGATGQRTTTTSAQGAFLFTQVAPGSYTLEATDLPGYTSSTPNSRPLSLGSGGSATANFGDQAAGTISGIVFEDLNGNGLRDAGEPPIGGVSILLLHPSGQRSTATSGTGTYLFAGVAPGTYSVEEIDPVGFTSTTPNVRTVSLASGGSATANFGDQAAGTVGGLVFDDANGNGARDSGEAGIGGVTIRLIGATGQRTTTTTGDGSYQFSGVAPGAYTVEEIDPVGFSSITPNQRSVAVASGGAATANFADQAAGSIAGVVFGDLNGNGLHDPGEAGIGGVTLHLVGAGSQRTTLTSGDGTYHFPALLPGAYTVEEIDPVGFASTTPNLRAVNLASGAAATASFGDQPVQTISGVVFEDQNGNGTFDPGEPGIGGVQLVLLRATDEVQVAQTLTSGNGIFAFTDVPVGNYLVRQAIPADYTVLTNPNPATPSLHGPPPLPTTVVKPVQMASGGAASVSFGNNVVGSLSGSVFNDLDGNGLPSPGESGVGGAAIELRHPNTGALIASTLTSGSGVFLFPNLTSGSLYDVRLRPVEGFAATATTLRVSLAAGAATANFPLRAVGSVSGRVYNDENGNGRPDTGEPGLAGVRMTLERPATGARLETLTSGDGSFLFAGVTPGDLRLLRTVPTAFEATTAAPLDITLAAGNAASATFGLRSAAIRPPTMTTEPTDLTLPAGASGSLSVVATGSAPLEYQWLKDGAPLPGQTSPTLGFVSARPTDTGSYQVRVRNGAGTVLSRTATVRVTGGSTGAYDAWTVTQNLPPALRQPHQDPDGDRISNLLEFILGTNPLVPNPTDQPRFDPVIANRNGGQVLGYEFRTTRATSSRFFLETSTDLFRWTEIPSTLELGDSNANGQLLRLLDRVFLSSEPYRFLRLGVALVETPPSPAVLRIVSGPPVATTFRLELEGQAGVTYTIERSDDLVTWTLLGNVVAADTPAAFTDGNLGNATAWFYRAVAR